MPNRPFTFVLCGSFRRAQDQLAADFDMLTALGGRVLSPVSVDWAEERDGFVYARHEIGRAPQDIEAAHLDAMTRADLVWMHLPDGYLGVSAAAELGFARGRAIPLYARTDVSEPGLRGQIIVVKSIAEAVDRAHGGSGPGRPLATRS